MGSDVARLIYTSNDANIRQWMQQMMPNHAFVANKTSRGFHLSFADPGFYRWISAPGFVYMDDNFINSALSIVPHPQDPFRQPCANLDPYFE